MSRCVIVKLVRVTPRCPAYGVQPPAGYCFTDGSHEHLEWSWDEAKKEAKNMESEIVESDPDCTCKEE